MKPSCAIDEYPTTSVADVCVNAITDPYRMLATAITSISSWYWAAASGNSGSAMRRKP